MPLRRTSILVGRELSIDRCTLGMMHPGTESELPAIISKATTWSKLTYFGLDTPVIRPQRRVEPLGAEGSDERIIHPI